jgi:transposase-like protein
MGRRVFSREFKTEAARLDLKRGVRIGEAAKDLGIHENLLRKWALAFSADLWRCWFSGASGFRVGEKAGLSLSW